MDEANGLEESNRSLKLKLQELQSLETRNRDLEVQLATLEKYPMPPPIAPPPALENGGETRNELSEQEIKMQKQIGEQANRLLQLQLTIDAWTKDEDGGNSEFLSIKDEPVRVEPNAENTPPPPVPILQMTTSLSAPALKGETVLQVASARGFKVGQRIRIGTTIFEEAIIKSFGSIHLTEPLQADHEVGATVTAVSEGRPVPHIHIARDADEDEATTRVDSDGASSGGETKMKTNGKPNLPNRPKMQSEVSTFQMDIGEAILQVSNRLDSKEKDWLDEVLTMEVDDPRLDEVERKMIPMDRNLRPGLLRLCKQDSRLGDDIERKRKEYHNAKNGKVVTSRKMLAMLYSSLATSKISSRSVPSVTCPPLSSRIMVISLRTGSWPNSSPF